MVVWHERSLRQALAAGLVAVVCAGCYSYRPLTEAEPAAGTPVSLVLNDQGRVAVAESVGTGVLRVGGTVVRSTDNTWVVAISDILDIDGHLTKWSGETVGFQRSYVAVLQERQLSKRKTILLVSSLVVGLGTFIATRHLLGISLPLIDSGSGGGEGSGQ